MQHGRMDGSSLPVVGVDMAIRRFVGVANVLLGSETRLPSLPPCKRLRLARQVRNVLDEILWQVAAKSGRPACHADRTRHRQIVRSVAVTLDMGTADC